MKKITPFILLITFLTSCNKDNISTVKIIIDNKNYTKVENEYISILLYDLNNTQTGYESIPIDSKRISPDLIENNKYLSTTFHLNDLFDGAERRQTKELNVKLVRVINDDIIVVMSDNFQLSRKENRILEMNF